MNMYIAVLPGDGIGPEITTQALRVAEVVARRFKHHLHYQFASIGAQAIERVGTAYPNSTHALCMECDAVLLGAIARSKSTDRIRPEQALMSMRESLGLYAKIRPIKLFSVLRDQSPLKTNLVEKLDLVCIQELTSGFYSKKLQGRSEDGFSAFDTCNYNRLEIDRVIELAFRYAHLRRSKITVVDKANILATSRLWREVAQEVGQKYPHVNLEFSYIEDAVSEMMRKPSQFDVIVTDNLFGDILMNQASALTGAKGILPTASIGQYASVFSPAHGPVLDAAGLDIANPLAAILSVAMMFDYSFGLKREARFIRQAVKASLAANIRTADIQEEGLKPYSTHELGDWITNYLTYEDIV